MLWIVEVKNSDGSIADVVTVDWAAARSAVEAHRSSKREIWIVDAGSRIVNKEPDDSA